MSTPTKSTEKELSQVKSHGNETKKNEFAKIYRSFSRKKYLKYKHQFPRLKETDVINKIIKQWQSMSKEEKLSLKPSQNDREVSDSEDSGTSKDDQSGQDSHSKKTNEMVKNESKKEEVKEKLQEIKIQLQKSTNTKMLHQPKVQDIDSGFPIPISNVKAQLEHELKQEENSQSTPAQQSKAKVEEKKVKIEKQKKQMKTKKKIIQKQVKYSQLKNGEYIIFYKHYYSKLKQQHPKWSRNQIIQIIKLLWRKKKYNANKGKFESIEEQKRIKRESRRKSRVRTPISGKELFVRQKLKQSLCKPQIQALWKQLPRESKNDWAKRGAELGSKPIITNANILTSDIFAKEQSQSKPKKTIISFRNLLLNERRNRAIPKQNLILEQKKEAIKDQSKKVKLQTAVKRQKQPESEKKQEVEYVSLQSNPFAFLKNKIDTSNKIVLE